MPGNARPTKDERDNLIGYLDQMRNVLKIAAYGLTDEQARAVPTASPLSVGGLVKHVTRTERGWMDTVLEKSSAPTDSDYAAYVDGFRMFESETLADILGDYDRAAAETGEIIANISDLGQRVPVPKDVPWFPRDVDAWSVRWVLAHLIQETARHAGHADIIREHIDGATAFPLMAAAENWPDTPWMQKWQPAQAVTA
jgi:uncharacterized damage-inducible protein DinB